MRLALIILGAFMSLINAKEYATFSLDDVDRIVNNAVRQSQASILSQLQQCQETTDQQASINRQQAATNREQAAINREQASSIMKQALSIKKLAAINRKQAATIKELTGRINRLENPSDHKSDRKRLVLQIQGEVDLQQAVVSLNQKLQTLQASQGVSYVRWGRTTCPNGTDLIYSGFAAGSYYDSRGGGSNFLCLPSDPTWGYYVPGQQTGAEVFGAEYENYATGYSADQLTHFFGKDLADDDVPCAVCRSHLSSSVMIPGRNICYSGWRQEYAGYLVAEKSSFDSSEFVCMDGAPEAIIHGKANKNGALFYIAEADCGSLSCPPYVEGRELTCTVCTK